MINYSIFEPDFVFEGWDDFEPEYKTIELANGIKLKVKEVEDKLEVIRVLSSNPQDYLRSNITPGTLLKTELQFELQ